jgi:hypothetical protein
MGILVAAAVQFFKRVAGAGGDLSGEEVRLGFMHVINSLTAIMRFLTGLFNSELHAWEQAEPELTHAANGLGEVGYAEWVNWDRLLTVIMPHSQAWMDGRRDQVWARWLRGTYRPFVRLEHNRWVAQWAYDRHNTAWRHGWVDPNIHDWRQWKKWFDGWPHRDLSTLRGWLGHPKRFAWFAVPALARPLVDYYGQPDHKRLAEHLTQIVVDRSPGVSRHVERAAVAVLNTPGW